MPVVKKTQPIQQANWLPLSNVHADSDVGDAFEIGLIALIYNW